MTQLVLGQEAVSDQASETTAIPILLELLGAGDRFKDTFVSIQATATNGTIASATRRSGADYLLAVKADQPALPADVENLFARASTGLLDIPVGHRQGPRPHRATLHRRDPRD